MPRKQNPDPMSAQQQQEMVSEGMENFELPKSVVMKIAKSSIPEETRLTKETVLSLVKGSTVFINYLAATAHDVAVAKQHKSIAASDVLRALELMDFADLVEPLQNELQQYKDTGKPSHRKSSSAANGGTKGLSISIPPASSLSTANATANAAAISAAADDGRKKITIPAHSTTKSSSSATKTFLTNPGSASTAGKGVSVHNGKLSISAAGHKGKGKAVLDGDGDAVMSTTNDDDGGLLGDMEDDEMEQERAYGSDEQHSMTDSDDLDTDEVEMDEEDEVGDGFESQGADEDAPPVSSNASS